MKANNNFVRNVFTSLLLLFFIYAAVASLRYRYNHPEQTETQLFFNLKEILLWK